MVCFQMVRFVISECSDIVSTFAAILALDYNRLGEYVFMGDTGHSSLEKHLDKQKTDK
jgi:hypothetical protein